VRIEAFTTVPEDWPVGDFPLVQAAAHLQLAHTFLWGVRDGGVTAAVLLARVWPGEAAEIFALLVRPEWRRQGWARRLLEALLAAARAAGCPSVFLEVRDSNAAARALYESMNFKAVNVRRAYYAKPVEDAVVLERRLG
jgi:ribosomal-protein-alanine N-acetyltransferase